MDEEEFARKDCSKHRPACVVTWQTSVKDAGDSHGGEGTGTEGRWSWEAPGMELQALKIWCFLSSGTLSSPEQAGGPLWVGRGPAGSGLPEDCRVPSQAQAAPCRGRTAYNTVLRLCIYLPVTPLVSGETADPRSNLVTWAFFFLFFSYFLFYF